MNLLYSEVEEELRAGVREMLAERAPAARVLARVEGDEPYDPQLWKTLAAEMGLAGLAVPEDLGGAGASFREVAVVLEELGRAVAPVPYLGSAVIATAALLACARESRAAADLLSSLAAGDRAAALAVPFATPPGTRVSHVRVEDDLLRGRVAGVADALTADVLLVPAVDGLYAVEVDAVEVDGAEVDGVAAGAVARTPVVSLDMTRRLADLSFDGAPGRPLAVGEAGRRALDAALLTGAALLASEQLGVAQWCLDTTVSYVKERHQFGRPVGSFQAVKHRLADVWVDVTQARAVARYAAACASSHDGSTVDRDLPVAAALAQAHCGPVAVRAAEECVQLHGGIGFTWEHPAHLYLKRAKSASLALGTADRHRAALAGLVDLPA